MGDAVRLGDGGRGGIVNGLALCAGAGGLELGLHLAEPGYRTVGFVEREARAAASLVARMADSPLGEAPVWDDLGTFDGRRWRGCVDIVSAGFPCQPFSVAGQQRGIEDERHLWPDVARVIGEVCPAWVLLENVPGLATTIAPDGRSALETVCDDLQELGFAVAWDEFSAAEVGATHLRERIFIAGRLADTEYPERWAEHQEHRDAHRRSGFGRRGADVADAGRGGADGVQPERERRRYEPATAGGSGGDVGVFPPGRLAERAWRAVLAVRPDLAPAVEPPVRGVVDGVAAGLDPSRLALTGNGVVPLVAAHAWLTLRTRLEDLT